MGRNFESPFMPSEEASRPGLPFFSNSFMAIRPFLGDTPDAASSREPSARAHTSRKASSV